jgi:hypothetical protein
MLATSGRGENEFAHPQIAKIKFPQNAHGRAGETFAMAAGPVYLSPVL